MPLVISRGHPHRQTLNPLPAQHVKLSEALGKSMVRIGEERSDWIHLFWRKKTGWFCHLFNPLIILPQLLLGYNPRIGGGS